MELFNNNNNNFLLRVIKPPQIPAGLQPMGGVQPAQIPPNIQLTSQPEENDVQIPCEICHEKIRFSHYEEHSKMHENERVERENKQKEEQKQQKEKERLEKREKEKQYKLKKKQEEDEKERIAQEKADKAKAEQLKIANEKEIEDEDTENKRKEEEKYQKEKEKQERKEKENQEKLKKQQEKERIKQEKAQNEKNDKPNIITVPTNKDKALKEIEDDKQQQLKDYNGFFGGGKIKCVFCSSKEKFEVIEQHFKDMKGIQAQPEIINVKDAKGTFSQTEQAIDPTHLKDALSKAAVAQQLTSVTVLIVCPFCNLNLKPEEIWDHIKKLHKDKKNLYKDISDILHFAIRDPNTGKLTINDSALIKCPYCQETIQGNFERHLYANPHSIANWSEFHTLLKHHYDLLSRLPNPFKAPNMLFNIFIIQAMAERTLQSCHIVSHIESS
ncbi:MAG: hypothetical protein EZS28_032749 [Streblomastix strix]|uniref:Uncharacterized protein n=1 Tax=Streblomastix strix TaxID=222440 RepID=A0A5J4UNK9_9EUKA|nr:MAG: hypothetical protein EZS28_032749 [Streblomastix strix]